jgi:2,4-dienoyl-CoA reductase-like NADH-dependent reductase (Old Yellow Enzyme family)
MKTLFDETRIGPMLLRNRLVRSATWEAMADEAGRLTPRLLELYRQLAEGGGGLISTSATTKTKDTTRLHGMLCIPDSIPYDESVFRDFAAEIADRVSVPVILVGLNRTPSVMSTLLNTTGIEYFSLSRPLLRQPDLPNFWRASPAEPAKCISCDSCINQPDGNVCPFRKEMVGQA